MTSTKREDVVSWSFWKICRQLWMIFGEGDVGCVYGGKGYCFESFGGPHVQKVNIFFPTHVNIFQHFFHFSSTVSILKVCGNSRGHIKKKWNFQGCWRKTHVEFPRVLSFDVRISKGVTQFCRSSEGNSLFSLEFLKVKL